MACVVSPDVSEAIRHVLFPLDASVAIWLVLLCRLSSPNALVAIWHVLFVFA